MAERELIRRLQRRIQTEPTVDMACCPPIRPRPPVSQKQLAQAEAKIGFPLPPLVRDIYTQVGDGGFGPGYGFIQLGHLVVRRQNINAVEECPDEEEDYEPLEWPDQFVDLVGWGCLYYSGILCDEPSCPVLFFNCDRAGEGSTLEDYLIPEAESLEEWLSAWLDGVNLWKRGTEGGIHR